MKFEWDENKNKANKLKHRVSPEEAETVFDDKTAGCHLPYSFGNLEPAVNNAQRRFKAPNFSPFFVNSSSLAASKRRRKFPRNAKNRHFPPAFRLLTAGS